MVADEKVKSAISKVVRDKIHSGKILNVVVNRDTTTDGDNILNVYVIFDSKNNKIDARETIGITRQVRNNLSEIGEDSFPIFFYVAKSEAGDLAEAK
ncbi:hypothetical protein [Mesorhizobium sp. M7A.F.Ca.US.008.03.1.1]|uniref:hypothetical protein n=1 Tax=Mesorhizobium sp. M7A.F.Ca.US.008.03.1.1 TaxID=2496742 RepID=UPI000FCC99BC|nr:hypothetical protein [Mesorhizobium sp. M7A.F.Ca.US.008.03.1.1]RUW60974.1 hypothetical protein EOA16_14325 [Mesorhizobium sp. M7A.F.Ca.US.008.03.1.1]